MGLSELLAAFVPMDRRQAMAEGRSLPTRSRGAVLFADISGFTPLTEALEKAFGARRGGEELTRHLNGIFAALIGEVHRFRGSVIGFTGDALMCWFDDDDGVRAASCGWRLQQITKGFQAISIGAGASVLSIKVAVAGGSARRFRVGDPQIQLLDALLGDVLDRAAQAEAHTAPGELVVTREVAMALGARAEIREQAGGTAVVAAFGRVAEPDPWPPIDPSSLPEEELRPWVLPAVCDRLRSGQGAFLAEIRQAAALFLRFGGLDFEGDRSVDEKLDAYVRWVQHVLGRFEGCLLQLTIGDKGAYFYAAFGVPTAQEDVVHRALAAACALRSPPQHLSFIESTQIGISHGPMRSGAYGSDACRTFGALGDETNVAARLMMRAEHGQIVVSERIVDAGRAMFRFDPLGIVTLKGKDAMPLFALGGRRRARQSTRLRAGRVMGESSAVSALTVMVGRTAERAVFHRAIDRFHAGDERVTVLVEGEAGLGKSRLLADVLDYARLKTSPPLRLLFANAEGIERSTPYFAWRGVFAQLFSVDPLAEPGSIVKDILERLPPTLLPLSSLLNPLLEVLLPETAGSAQLGSLRPARIPRYLTQVLAALLGKDRAFLVVEDAHWLDPSSWALLDLVRRELPGLMIIVTTRPLDEPPSAYQSLRGDVATEVVRLEAMSPDEAVTLVCNRLGVDELPESVRALISAKAEGNPFFAEEVAFALRDANLIRIQGGVCHVLSPLDGVRFPDTIEGVVTSRIDRLAPVEQLTLKVASVVGRAFRSSTLEDIFPIPRERDLVPESLDALTRLDLTVCDAPLPELTYTFKHAVTLEVSYNLMLFEQRRPLHEAVADWYERVHADDLRQFYAVIAHHRFQAIAGLARPDERRAHAAAVALVRAGRQSLETGATSESISLLGRALPILEMLPASRQRSALELDVRCALGASLAVVRGPTHAQVRVEFDRARELCDELGDPTRLFEALYGLWYSNLTSAMRKGALEFSAQLLEVAERTKAPTLLALAHQAVGSTAVGDGDHAKALDHLDRVLVIAKQPGAFAGALSQARDPVVVTHLYRAWAHLFMGRVDSAVADCETAVELAHAVSHPLTLTQALIFAALTRRYRREHELAESSAQRAMALATEHGFPFWIGVVASAFGWIAIERGDYMAGIATLQRTMLRNREEGVFPVVTGPMIADLIHAFTCLGRYDEAITLLDEFNKMLEIRLAAYGAPEVFRREGELWAKMGDHARAGAAMRRARDLAVAQGAKLLELRAAVTLARYRRERGEADDGHLQRIYDSYPEGHETRDMVDARGLLDDRNGRDVTTSRSTRRPDIEGAAAYVVNRLERELGSQLKYHCVGHTRDDVLPAALRLAKAHGLAPEDELLLHAGALFHDLGFIECRKGHEAVGVRIARETLPGFGFDASQIERIAGIIMATKLPQTPTTLLERLLADADLDVLGREDFFEKNDALRRELAAHGHVVTDVGWWTQQLSFLTTHGYFTEVAASLRGPGKALNAAEMQRRLLQATAARQ
jgi:class 3 adenylate cyclase/tetratricopeptide (TPR) repeat protein